MGTEISDSDITHIHSLCEQVISISEYRSQLAEYLRNRMNAIAPNLTALVGDLVGARLISHAGILLNLAKHPASTVQILGLRKPLSERRKRNTILHNMDLYTMCVFLILFCIFLRLMDRLGFTGWPSTTKTERQDGPYGGDKSCAFYPCRRSH